MTLDIKILWNINKCIGLSRHKVNVEICNYLKMVTQTIWEKYGLFNKWFETMGYLPLKNVYVTSTYDIYVNPIGIEYKCKTRKH